MRGREREREVGPASVREGKTRRRVTKRVAFKIFSIINNTEQWAATQKANGDSNKTSVWRKGDMAGRIGREEAVRLKDEVQRNVP